jgi:hypothetical protein
LFKSKYVVLGSFPFYLFSFSRNHSINVEKKVKTISCHFNFFAFRLAEKNETSNFPQKQKKYLLTSNFFSGGKTNKFKYFFFTRQQKVK